MSSEVAQRVSRLLRRELKPHRFAEFTKGGAWRHWAEGIDVVVAESVGRNFAAIEGIPASSFTVSVAIRLNYLPHGARGREKDGKPLPEPAKCHIRKELRRLQTDPRYPRDDVWYVPPGGEDLQTLLDDACAAVLDHGLAWLERFRDPHEVLRTFEEDGERKTSAWDFGSRSSPKRRWLCAHASLRVGKLPRARDYLEELLSAEPFWRERAEKALDQLTTS